MSDVDEARKTLETCIAYLERVGCRKRVEGIGLRAAIRRAVLEARLDEACRSYDEYAYGREQIKERAELLQRALGMETE